MSAVVQRDRKEDRVKFDLGAPEMVEVIVHTTKFMRENGIDAMESSRRARAGRSSQATLAITRTGRSCIALPAFTWPMSRTSGRNARTRKRALSPDRCEPNPAT